MQKKYLIIGAAAAGISAANTLFRLDPQASIVCLSDEVESPYNKCFLADYIAHEKDDEQIGIFSASAANKKNITLSLGVRAQFLDKESKKVACSTGEIFSYDALLIATGSRPIVPLIRGINDYSGVFTFHTLRDMHGILKFCKQRVVRRAVVIGAGLSGIECADALMRIGISSIIIERENRVLSAFTNYDSGQFLYNYIVDQRILIYLNQSVERVVGTTQGVSGVVLADGTHIVADMVIYATGLIPNAELARFAGLTMYESSIWVDDYMRTSDSAIYAAGDVVVVKDAKTGSYIRSSTWPDAMHQGMIAAHGMVGLQRAYPGITQIASSSFFGVKFFSTGLLVDSSYSLYEKKSEHSLEHYLFDSEGRLHGFLLIGSQVHQATAKRLLITGQSDAKKALL